MKFHCGIMSLPLRVGFFVVSKYAPRTQSYPMREVHKDLSVLPMGSNNMKWEVPLTWLMMQESRLLSFAPSVSREITTRRKTRRTILTDLSSRSTASFAASTLFTKNLSDFGGEYVR